MRIALRAANVPFEDERLNFAQLTARKADSPTGQWPIIQIDGKTYTQSGAMLRWAGKKGGLYPTDDFAAFRVDEALGLLEDLMTSVPREADPEAHKTKREAWVANKAPIFLGLLNTRYTESGGPYLLGSEMSVADLVLVGTAALLESGMFDHVPKDMLAAYPSLVKAAEEGKKHPLVAAELASYKQQ